MNYPLAVAINRKLLSIIAEELVTLLGGLSVEVVQRHLHLAVLAVLRPAESAVRRLIAVLAHGLAVPGASKRDAPVAVIPKGSGERIPSFPLFDPRLDVDPKVKRVPGHGPSVRGLGGPEYFPPIVAAPQPDDPVKATGVVRRLRALSAALDDMPRQAKRLARAMARKARPIRAMRPGRPPGHRSRPVHPVDAVLAECHRLALMALDEPVPAPP